MTLDLRAMIAFLAVIVMIVGCAPARAPSDGNPASDPGRSSAPKRITTAIRGNPHTVYQKLNPRSNVAGITELEVMVNAPLAYFDGSGNLQARLAEAVPSIDNSRWRLFPDGSMETSWTIRDGARWHDGVALTADDLLFTLAVVQDKEIPIFGDIAYASLESAWAVDPRTVTVKWKQPYIQADRLFTYALALPMPKHVLEAAYAGDKSVFTEHPYWSEEFVGTGPYRVRAWERGSHLVLAAHDGYLLGRPRIDEIIVRYIPDPATLAANILAGEVDVTMEGRLSIEWATTVRDQWRGGNVDFKSSSMLQIFPQFVNPTPPLLSNVEFRKAMMYALDRQEMVDTLVFGLTSVGHTFVAPSEPEYRAVESSLVEYDHDPRRATELLEGLGYRRAADGIFRDGAGQKLAFEIRTSQGDDRQEKAMFATADQWQRLGAEVERTLVPPQRAADGEYRSTFPAFDLKGQAGTFDYAPSFHSSRVPLAENNYRVAGNNARYMSPALDALVDRYYITIPIEERLRVAGQMVHHISDQVVWMGLYYSVTPLLIHNRLTNVAQAKAARASTLSNVHEWDLR